MKSTNNSLEISKVYFTKEISEDKIVDMLNKSIDNLISKLNIMGIEATKLNLRENHIFILDSVNGQVITPSNQNIQETIKRK